jgi:hypothetical protein
MDAFKELVEKKLLSKLKDLIKPRFGMKATNVCESINSIYRSWLGKSERPSARQYMAYMYLADCHACERAIWIHTDNETWREKIYARVAEKLGIPVAIFMPPEARTAYRKETETAAKRSQSRKTPEFRMRENRRRTRWRKKKSRKSGEGYESAIVDSMQEKMAEGTKKTKKKTKSAGSGRCKCGSTDHKRVNHSDCPLNKRNIKMATLNAEPVDACASEEAGSSQVEAAGEYDEMAALLAMIGGDGDDTLLNAIVNDTNEDDENTGEEVAPTTSAAAVASTASPTPTAQTK